MKIHIYADNAATTKLDKKAFDAMLPWLLEDYGNASQPYSFARNPKKALANARATIAECIGADPEEIYFTSGGSEGDNWVLKSQAFSSPQRFRIITSAFEHHAILHSCASMENIGYEVEYINPDEYGYITSDFLKTSIGNDTRLVSIMYANNEIGTIQPIRELAEIAHANGALFHTDAVQAVGHVKINVHDLGIDYLSASAHKFNGPKGVGFLYIKKGLHIPPLIDGGSQESGRRAGTENIAAIAGMAEALRINCNNLDQNMTYIRSLEQKIIEELDKSGIDYKRNGGAYRLPGLLSLSFPEKEGEAILHRMDLMGISISTGSACDSVNTEISHVLNAIRLDEKLARGTIRISLGKNNTSDEVDRIVKALIKILN